VNNAASVEPRAGNDPATKRSCRHRELGGPARPLSATRSGRQQAHRRSDPPGVTERPPRPAARPTASGLHWEDRATVPKWSRPGPVPARARSRRLRLRRSPSGDPRSLRARRVCPGSHRLRGRAQPANHLARSNHHPPLRWPVSLAGIVRRSRRSRWPRPELRMCGCVCACSPQTRSSARSPSLV